MYDSRRTRADFPVLIEVPGASFVLSFHLFLFGGGAVLCLEPRALLAFVWWSWEGALGAADHDFDAADDQAAGVDDAWAMLLLMIRRLMVTSSLSRSRATWAKSFRIAPAGFRLASIGFCLPAFVCAALSWGAGLPSVMPA